VEYRRGGEKRLGPSSPRSAVNRLGGGYGRDRPPDARADVRSGGDPM